MEQADKLLARISVNILDVAQFKLSLGIVSSVCESKMTIIASLCA